MENAQIIVHPETHSLVVSGETYSMTKVPDAASKLVQAEIQNVLHDLSLAGILTDLDRAADLIYLAYNGVAGTGVLAASVSSRQKDLGDLCAECVVAMTAFRQGALDILGNLVDAYENLLEAEEEIALDILAECGDYAKTMAAKCHELAEGFKKLQEDTREDAKSAEIAVGAQVEKLAELKKLRDEMNATLAEQQANIEQLRARVEELKDDIAEAKEQEETESERAFIGGMVGACAGAVGSGLGAYAASRNPIGQAVASMQPAGGNGAQPGGNGAAPADPEKVAAAKASKETAEADVKKKEAAVDEADKELKAATEAVEDAEADYEAKKEAVTTARASDDAEAITAADKAVEAASETVAEAKKKEVEAEEAKKSAETALLDATAALNAAAATMKSLSESLTKMSAEAQNRADQARSVRLSLISEKREQERLKREALSQVAGLTSRLKSSDEEKTIHESSQYALEMAVWAFANIYAALSNAKFFWDNMATYCDRLSDPYTRNLITRELKKSPEDTEKRKAYYSSERFMDTAIFYLIRWKALETICDGYVKASEAARTKVLNNIRSQPTVSEARSQLARLKGDLQAKLNAEMLQSKQRAESLEAEQNLLMAIK